MDPYDSDNASQHSSLHRQPHFPSYSNYNTERTQPNPKPRNRNLNRSYADSDTGSRHSSTYGKYSQNNYSDNDTGIFSEHEDEQPLQLIEIRRDNGANNKLYLDLRHEILDEVLKTCQNRKICSIFVTGPARSGKSFFLNCIKDKIQEMENDGNSLRRRNKEFTGFPFEAGYQGVTKGIWVWNRAFCVATNNDEIAVLLFDTEGIDDELMKPDEILAILGFSLLSSSLLIFNTSGNISSSEHKWIFPLCERADREQLPDLSILIRDWTDFAKFQYNGRAYFESVLKKKSALTHSKIQWNCTVLPHIGESASSRDFRGRESALDKVFKEHLQSYLNRILNKQNLSAKSVFRNEFTKNEYKFFLVEAVNFINSAVDPSNNLEAVNLWSALNDSVQKFKIQNGLDEYKTSFQNLQQYAPGGYLHESVIQNNRREAEDRAIQAFKAFRFRQADEMKLVNNLKQRLDGVYEQFKHENHREKESKHLYAINNAVKIFNNEMQPYLPVSSNDDLLDNDDLSHFDESLLNDKINQAKENAEKQLLIAIPEVGAEDKANLLDKLRMETGKVAKLVKERNEKKIKKAEEKSKIETERLIEEYQTELQSHYEDRPDMDEKVWRDIHYFEMKKIEKKFSGITLGSASLGKETLQLVKKQIDKRFEAFMQKLKPTTHSLNENPNSDVQTNIPRTPTPKPRLRSSQDHPNFKNSLEFQTFSDFHNDTFENAKKQTTSPRRVDKLEKSSSLFQDNSEYTYPSFTPNINQRRHKEVESLDKAIADATEQYQKEMNTHKENMKNGYFADSELQQINKDICSRILSHLIDLYDLNSIQRNQLEEALSKLSKKFKSQNDMVKQTFNDDIAIGIDLGTTYCCVAAYIKGKVEIVENGHGKKTTPSYVLINKDGTTVVGSAAKDKAFRNLETTIYDAKRIIGRRFDDPKLQEDMKFWPFNVKEDNGDVFIEAHGNNYYPEGISSMILKHLKEDTEQQLGVPITKAVITVPAYFSDGQRQATIDAGELAGLEVLEILNEPTAAALAYRLECFDVGRTKKVLVYDFGGGTFDVSILSVSDCEMEVLGISGDTHLGGQDIDKNMMEYCAAKFQEDTKINIFEGKDDAKNRHRRSKALRYLNRLQKECEETKKSVSSARTASSKFEVSIDNFAEDQELIVELTRDLFDAVNMQLYEKTIEITKDALDSAGLTQDDIDEVIMVGGSTRIKKVQDMVSDFFGGKTLCNRLNPDEAIAYGAAVQAAALNCKSAQKLFDFGKIQEVTPMSLGVQLIDKTMDIIIPRNTKIPNTFTEQYKTHMDMQTSVVIPIYQGEDTNTANNKFLGTFNLNGIPPGPACKEIVDVTMHIDKNGILTVEAVCKSTMNKESLTIVDDRGGYGKVKKQRMLAEARE